MRKSYSPEARAAFCRAVGIPAEDVNRVRRVVVDICSDQATRVLVEYYGDDEAIGEAMTALMLPDVGLAVLPGHVERIDAVVRPVECDQCGRTPASVFRRCVVHGG